jgi:hypothetical protein
MIQGGWEYIWPAYAVAVGGLTTLTVIVLARLRAWSRRARDLDRAK